MVMSVVLFSAQADFGPALDRVVAEDGLQQDDAGRCGAHAIGGVGRQQRLVAFAQDDAPHLLAGGLAIDPHGPLLVAGHQWRIELDQFDRDFTVHAQRELVVGAGPPLTGPLGADRLQHVLHVLADSYLLPWLRGIRHLEDVGERVVLGLVVDQLDRPFVVVGERPELRHVLSHATPWKSDEMFALRTLVRYVNIVAGGVPSVKRQGVEQYPRARLRPVAEPRAYRAAGVQRRAAGHDTRRHVPRHGTHPGNGSTAAAHTRQPRVCLHGRARVRTDATSP